jgi:hypothetical protein
VIDRPRLLERCRGLARDKREYVLVLDDGHVAQRLRLKVELTI